MEFREEQYLEEEIPAGLLAIALPDDLSTRLVDRLKREADRSWYSDPLRSLQFASRIVDIGRHRDDPNQIALGLLAQGNALKFAVRPVEAWDALQQSGRMFQFAGNEFGWARTRISLLGVALFLGRMGDALIDARRARAIFREQKHDDMLVRLDIEEGLLFTRLGDHQRGLQLFHDGLAIAANLSDRGQLHQAPLYLNIGYTYEKLGDYHQALAYFEPAHELLLARDATYGSDTAKINIAYVARIQGRYRYALKMLQEVIERAGQRSLPEKLMAQGDLVECYLHLNRFAEARGLAQSVVAAYRELHHVYELARMLLHVALAEAEAQNFDAAEAALSEAEQIFAGLGARAWVGNTWLERGQIALQRGDLRSALACAANAAGRFESGGLQEKLAQASLLQGRSLLGLGEWQPAAEAAGKSLQIARERDVPSLRYQSYLLLGNVAEAQQDHRGAARRYQAAAATMDRVQSGLTITLRAGYLEDKEEALRSLISLHLRHGREREAFETLERAKAQVLLGYLTNRDALRWSQDDARNRVLLDQLNRLRAEHQRFYGLAHRLPGSAEQDAMPPNAALAESKTREREMRAIIEQLYLQSGEGLEAHRPANASFDDIQRAVRSESLLVEYYVDGAGLWAFVLDGCTITARRLPIDAGAVSQLLSQLRMNVTVVLGQDARSPLASRLLGTARRILQRLYDGLIGPLMLDQSRRRRLLLVPYGPLHYLPFHLLFDGAVYLIEKFEVVILPAANVALRPAPRREPGALVLTHSWDGRLPQTLPEGRMVQAVMGGALYAEEAARRAVLQAPPAQVLHIAAHGEHRLDQPELSYLQLADGQLYADDLLQHDLSYELVTLSACETGRAKAAAHDELIGLGRGFLYSGAGSLLVSLWQVDDTSTYRLMDGFYRALHAGMPKGEALRNAQREMLLEQPGLHPAHWGAFQLIGDAGPLSGPAH
jgi:CHAT domain-containing protein